MTHTLGNKDKIILLLHPMLLDGCTMLKHFEPLSDEYRLIAPDLSAHGESRNEEFISAEREADGIASYLKQNGAANCTAVIGLSLGGRIALELLKDSALNFSCAVLDGAPVYKNARLRRFLYTTVFLHRRKHVQKNPEPAKQKLSQLFGTEAGIVMTENFQKMTKRSIKNIMDTCSRFDFYPYTQNVQQRMYFEFGAEETDAAQSKIILQKYPHVHLTKRENYGHCQYLTGDKDGYLAMIRQYILEQTA